MAHSPDPHRHPSLTLGLVDVAPEAYEYSLAGDVVDALDPFTEADRRRWAKEAADVHLAAKRLDATVDEDATRLVSRLMDLEDRGLVEWNDWTSTWQPKAPRFRVPFASSRRSIAEADLLQHFDKVRKTGRGWSARCPAHRDRSPSLSIAEGHTCWLLKCWVGCDIYAIAGSVGLRVGDLRVEGAHG